jgi:L-fuconolactonase
VITDSQVHLWAANTPERPWPAGSVPQRDVPLEAPELLSEMGAAGVDRAVIVPPNFDGGRNDIALDAAALYPDRFGVMGRLDILQPQSVDLASWLDVQGMLGVRVAFFKPADRSRLTDGSAEWLFEGAEKLAIPMMIYAPGQHSALLEIARRHPDLRIIVDHLNLATDLGGAEVPREIEAVMTLAVAENIAMKISALPCHVEEGFPFPSLHPVIRSVVTGFGADRCMWGSDLSRLPCPYGEWVRTFTEAIDFLNSDEVQAIMGGSLARWLDWPPAEEG